MQAPQDLPATHQICWRPPTRRSCRCEQAAGNQGEQSVKQGSMSAGSTSACRFWAVAVAAVGKDYMLLT